MNPLTNVKNVKKLSEQELKMGNKTSWHDQYKDSAWIFIGGLPYDLTEGDIICVFSQYGEIVNINLIRDKDTGKQKGFCFLCYEDQRSTILAVDNLNGIKILSRTIRVDHVSDYKIPKDYKKLDEETRKLQNEGCAPGSFVTETIASPADRDVNRNKDNVEDIQLPERLPIGPSSTGGSEKKKSKKKEKKHKKDKKKKKKAKKLKKKSRKESSDSDSSSERSDDSNSSKESFKKRKIKTENDENIECDSSKIRRTDFDRDEYSRGHNVPSNYDYKRYKYSSEYKR